ncbi:hypothetical protein [Vibrio renipiscarius]|uniref:hypothetical protein n=1 Tax=Vibrio renipiscarius TaxID=1461322 RepID=UPI0006993EB3|nr:hypothetical protein [Vibrio renipiscarius]
MLKTTNILEAVRERDIDLLLIEELHTNKLFNQWFLASILGSSENFEFKGAWHSIVSYHGESDIIVLYEATDGTALSLLIENKIDATPQQNQAERYNQRGEEGLANGEWHSYKTCIVAPAQYLHSNQEKYQYELSYECIMEHLLSLENVRSTYKGNIILAAIEQQRRGFQKSVNQQVTEFGIEYTAYLQENYPFLNVDVYEHDRAKGTDWFYFKPYSNKAITLEHQLSNGRIVLRFTDDRLINNPQIITAFINNCSIEGLEYKPAIRSVGIAMPTPKILPDADSFSGSLNSINQTLNGLITLYHIGEDPLWTEFD